MSCSDTYVEPVDPEFFRPCPCAEEFVEDKSFCYVEGSELDKSTSQDVNELSENLWFTVKPPRSFGTSTSPLVSARQLQIERARLVGKKKEDESHEKEKPKLAPADISKKKSSVRFLSSTLLM